VFKLFIVRILFKRCYWYAVVQLFAKRVDCIVDYDYVTKRHVPEDAEVFDVDVIRSLDALVSVEAVLYQITRWVDKIEDSVSVAWIWGCEHTNFEVFVRILEYILRVRPDVEACIQKLAAGRGYIQHHVWLFEQVLVTDAVS